MQNLLRFLVRYNFQILFVILEVIAFSLVLSVNPIPRSRAFRFTEEVSGYLYQQFNRLGRFMNMRDENRKLIIENAQLRSQLALISTPEENPKDSLLISELIPYQYYPARVINNSVHRQNNYFTLDAGSDAGLEPDMGVIGPHGIAGIIRNVSKHYSVAISVLNSGFKVSAKLKDTGFYGSFEWDGKNYRHGVLVDIPSYSTVQVGDSIVTSGFSAIFPEGLYVGKVIETSNSPGGSFYRIVVDLGQDFKKLSHVYVIRNMNKEEKTQLEATFDE